MKFDQWFIKQHGKRPSRESPEALGSAAMDAQLDFLEAQRMARDCNLWDEQYKSAMYAWNIKDKDKKAKP